MSAEPLESRLLLSGDYLLPSEHIAYEPGGDAIIVHTDGAKSLVTRLKSAKAVDPAFGSSGQIRVAGYFSDIATQADGKFIIAGTATGKTAGTLILERFFPTGRIDPSFAKKGIFQSTQLTVPGSPHLAIQKDGTILVAASVDAPEPRTDTDCWIAYLSPKGVMSGDPYQFDLAENDPDVKFPTQDRVLAVWPPIITPFSSNSFRIFSEAVDGDGNRYIATTGLSPSSPPVNTSLVQFDSPAPGHAPLILVSAAPMNALNKSFAFAAYDGQNGYIGQYSRSTNWTATTHRYPGFLPQSLAQDNAQTTVAGASRQGRQWDLAYAMDQGPLRVNRSVSSSTPSALAGMFEGNTLVTLNFAQTKGAPRLHYTPARYPDTSGSLRTTVQMEDVAAGGQGISYYDKSPANLGGAYRVSSVDVAASPEADGGYYVTSTQPGEWLDYVVQGQGDYRIELRVSSIGIGGTFHIELNGQDQTGPLRVPDTRGQWQSVSFANLDFGQGYFYAYQSLRIVMDSAGRNGTVGNFDSFQLIRGTFDPTFGQAGEVVLNDTGSATSAVEQPDGKILVYSDSGNLYRLTSTGSLDRTFGNGGVVADFPGPNFALQSTGDIVVSAPDGLRRYLPNGNPDPTFGVNGVAPDTSGRLVPLWIAPDDTILGGFAFGVTVFRLTDDGLFDPSFGDSGQISLHFRTPPDPNAGQRQWILAVGMRPDGTVVVAGKSDFTTDQNHEYWNSASVIQTLTSRGQLIDSEIDPLLQDRFVDIAYVSPAGQIAFAGHDEYPSNYRSRAVVLIAGESIALTDNYTLAGPPQYLTNTTTSVPFPLSSLAPESDGKLLLLGSKDGHVALARVTP